MSNRCPACKHENLADHRYCTQCGTRLSKAEETGPRLVVLSDEGDPWVYTLGEEPVTIGRGSSNTLVVRDDEVSKKHARISFQEGVYWVEDLGSRNGVFLNARRISQRERIGEGNIIKLGMTMLRFETLPPL
jgi:pSer/pThr/pTyr-binding forkhead associated (FHA) protein